MAKKKTQLLPRLELMIILIFFLSFAAWMFNKCGDQTAQYRERQAQLEAQERQDSLQLQGLSAIPSTDNQAAATPQTSTTKPAANEKPATSTSSYSTLYVTIDGLNMRDQPNLNGEILAKLKLFEAVDFLNEVTDSTTQLKLSEDIIADEPWVKVKNRKGKSGWVYGAGVHYYKLKYPGLD